MMSRTLIRSGTGIAASLILAAAGQAQVIDWNNASGGNWNDAAQWNPMNVPNASGEDARFNLAGTYTVTLNTDASIGRLLVNNANATLQFAPFNDLSLNALSHTNNGLVIVNNGSSAGNSINFLAGPATLSGSGTVTLMGNSNFNDTATFNTGGGVTLTNGSGHTINGRGRLNASLINNGIVEAHIDGSGLSVRTNDKTNNNIFRAINGGTLFIEHSTITQGSGGVIRAHDDSVVNLDAAAIVSGVVESTGSGLVSVSDDSSFRDVTFNGTCQIAAFEGLTVLGSGLVNNGEVLVNQSASAGTYFAFGETGTLSGPGTVRLDGNSGFNDTAVVTTAESVVMTQAAGHTIEGEGRIHASLVNNGVVDANMSNLTLQLLTNNKTNNNIFRATNGGTLRTENFTLTQGGSGVTRAAQDSNVHIAGTTVLGGTVESTGTGVVAVVSPNTTFRGVTFNGTGRIDGSDSLLITGTGFTNNGAFSINTGTSLGTFLRFDESGTLGGTGSIRLDGSSAFNTTAVLATDTGVTLTHGPSHTILGEGRITANLVNNGVVNADEDNRSIELTGENKTNNNLMRATNGGDLFFQGITVTQPANAQIRAENDSTVSLNGTFVDGGRVLSTGTGEVFIVGLNTGMRNVRLDGSATVSFGDSLLVTGAGLTNNAILRVNTFTSLGTFIQFNESGSLTGTGQVVLQGNSGTNSTAVLATDTGVTLTNASTHTIRGRGRVAAKLVNNGSVLADSATSFLELLVEDKTNNATIAASNGGTIQVNGITLTQGPAGVLGADTTSDVILRDTTLVGGTLNAAGASDANIAADSVFSGVSNLGTVQVNFGTTLSLQGAGNTNSGLIKVNTGASLTTVLEVATTQTIGGTGEVRLQGNSPDNATALLNTAESVTATWGPGQILTGQGRVAGDHVWNGPIAPGFSAGRISVFGTLTMTDSTVFRCELGGTSASSYDRLAGSANGTVNLDGTLDISFIEDFVPSECDSFQIVQAGSVVGQFDAITGADAPGDLVWRVFNDGTSATLKLTCYPDTDGSCTLDLFDILTFLNAFNAGSPDAECDNAPGLNLFDILCFLNEFNAGC